MNSKPSSVTKSETVKPSQTLLVVRLQGASRIWADSRWFVSSAAITPFTYHTTSSNWRQILDPHRRSVFVFSLISVAKTRPWNVTWVCLSVLCSDGGSSSRFCTNAGVACPFRLRSRLFLEPLAFCAVAASGPDWRPTAITALYQILYCTSDPALVWFLSCGFTSVGLFVSCIKHLISRSAPSQNNAGVTSPGKILTQTGFNISDRKNICLQFVLK